VRPIAIRASLIVLCAFLASAAGAASLRVAPVSLQLAAPAATAMLKLRSDGNRAVPVQLRVFRWSQSDTGDILTPTDAVVASPPFTTLTPGTEYTVRIVRVSGAPVRGEESYRVLIDQLPQLNPARTGRVQLLLRYSVPVFFIAADARPARLAWSLRRRGNRLLLAATNNGGQHRRIANVRLRVGHRIVAARNGLVGYVLPGHTATWPLKSAAVPRSGTITLASDGDEGALHATVALAR
jgi:fimbrial chaperone protein